jgi:hypothetical protein
MVPPQPRLPLRRPSGARWAVSLTIAVAALATVLVLGLGSVLPTPLKQEVEWRRGYPRWLQRAALRSEAPPFGGLAASQVGYGPSMVKQFSSPAPFASFQVVNTRDERKRSVKGASRGSPAESMIGAWETVQIRCPPRA